MTNRGKKRRGSSQANFLRRMKAIPLPGVSRSLHGEVFQHEAVGRFLDKELLGGVVSPSKRIRVPPGIKLASLAGVDLDAIDLELFGP